MDLRGMANSSTSVVNSNILVTIHQSIGFTIGSGGKQIPSYSNGISGYAQIQAMDSEDLKQLDGINVQGVVRQIYLRGLLAGVIRPNQIGGDIIMISNKKWLVTKVLETWPEWTRAVIVLQSD